MPFPVNVPKCWLLERRGRCVLRGVGKHTSASRPTATKIGDRTIYARRVLDRWLDELAGLVPGSNGVDLPPDIQEEKFLEPDPMHVKLRYIERRVDRSSGERWYWHRRGHKLTRLPNDLAERTVMAERLNAAADNVAPAQLARGSIDWVIQRYRDSDEFRDLSPGTVKYCRQFLREIEALGPERQRASLPHFQLPVRAHPLSLTCRAAL
jgi:hypothetical protein